MRVSLPWEGVVKGGRASAWIAREVELGAWCREVMSRSGVRGARLGGVDVRKWETGFEEGPTMPEEPALVALTSGREVWSPVDDAFA